MQEIIAIDKGTTYTKSSKSIIIRSTVREYEENEINLGGKKNIAEYEGKIYVVGERGAIRPNLFKSEHEETRLLVLTAIALSYPHNPNINVNLITGLPIGRYGYEKDSMNKLFRHTKNAVTLNGIRYSIAINKVETFPEGASSFYSLLEQQEGLIVDIGGLSIDTSLFGKNGVIEKYSTYRLGIMPLFREIANHIGSRDSITLDEWDINNVIGGDYFINGEKKALEVDHIIDGYVKEINQALNFNYNIPAINNVYLTGGGGEYLYPYIKEAIPRIKLMNNPQFTNVMAYQILGEAYFNEVGNSEKD